MKGGVIASFIETSFPQASIYLYKYRREKPHLKRGYTLMKNGLMNKRVSEMKNIYPESFSGA
jgi:hypothetical protein